MKALMVLAALILVPGVAAENFLVVAHSTTPFITIYSHDGDTFTKLANPATLPTGTGVDVQFNDAGTLMAVAHATSPFITIYSVSGTTFTKLSDPGTLPTGTGFGASFSPNGNFLAVAHATSPFITIYSVSGTTFTKLSDPATLPTGTGEYACWSADSQFLAVAHLTSPFITIYQRSGNTFTKLANPATLPTNFATGCDFSQDGNYLAVAHQTSPFITIYAITGTTFTKISNPGTLPTGQGIGARFSHDSSMLAVGHDTTPFITLYDIDGSTFTKRANPATLPAGISRQPAFNDPDELLAVPHDATPFVSVYNIADGVFTKLANPSDLPAGNGNSATFPSALSGPNQIFCAEPLAARFGYNFKEGFVFEDAGGNVPQSGYYSTATSDNADYLGLGFDKTSRGYEVHFTIAADTDSRTSTFRIVFSFTDDIPSVGNKGNQLVSTGSARESVRATFVEDNDDWSISLHEVVAGVSTEDDSDTIGDNPNVNGNFVFVVDTRTGTEEYRLEREDGTVLLNAALAAGHVEETVGSQWFVHRGGGATLGATLTLVDQDSEASGATGVSTCVTDLEGNDSLNAPPPGAPGGQGGSDGGTIGDQPFFPGVNVGEVATQSGMSLDQVGWMIGILLIVAFAAMLAPFGMIMAAVGGLSGLGLSIAFGLVPVWFLVFIIILVLGAIVYLRKG